MDAHSAVTAVGLANSAFSAVKTALDLSKKTTDLDLKREISNAFDNVLELKATVYELVDENRSLREQLFIRESLKRKSEFGYYFADGDIDPFCPKCYEGLGKAIHLTGAKLLSGGTRRECRVCGQAYWEHPPDQLQRSDFLPDF